MQAIRWKLVNAKSLQKKFPNRYLIPELSELRSLLKKGNQVQLVAKLIQHRPKKSIRVKFIHLEIIKKEGSLYYGRLIDDHAVDVDLDSAACFAFRPEHVLSIAQNAKVA